MCNILQAYMVLQSYGTATDGHAVLYVRTSWTCMCIIYGVMSACEEQLPSEQRTIDNSITTKNWPTHF